jgi:hypothetical protein
MRTILLVFLFSVSSRAWSQATCTFPTHEMCRVNNSTTSVITGEGGACRLVSNTSGADQMVPVKTAAEWSAPFPAHSFIARPPSGMAVSECDVTPNPLDLTNDNECAIWAVGGKQG